MDTTVTDMANNAQESLLGAMETSKAYALESMKAWSATTAKLLPAMPALPGLHTMGDGPMSMVSMSYDFAERLLASQRSFVEEMVDLMTPTPA